MQTHCFRCKSLTDSTDRFCRRCGLSFQSDPSHVQWYYQPLWLIVLGLFVLGPLVLPLVWKSPALNRVAKIWLSAGIIVYTVLLIYFTWLLVAAIYSQIQQVMSELRNL